MKLDFKQTHYVLRVYDDSFTVHAVNSDQHACMFSTYTSATNALDDLFQRISRRGGRWGALWITDVGGVFINVVRHHPSGQEYAEVEFIAEGTAVAIYYDLMPHLQMMRTT